MQPTDMHTMGTDSPMMVVEETMSNSSSMACGASATRNEQMPEIVQSQRSPGSVSTFTATNEIDGGSNHGKLLAEVTSSGIPAFPWRLHDMLDDAPRKGFESIVSWQMGGRAFKVHDTKLFVSNIMPNYFNQSHYKSFQRQLNIYGFQRLTHGKDKGAYTHELLVQGNSDMCRYMIRVKVKNKGSKTTSSLSSAGSNNGSGDSRRGRGIARNKSCPQTLLQMQRTVKSKQQQEEPLETDNKNALFLNNNLLESLPSSTAAARGISSTLLQHHRPTGATRKRSLSLGCILDYDSSKLSYASLQQPLGGGSNSMNQTWSPSSSNSTILQTAAVDPLFGRPSAVAPGQNNPMMDSRTTAEMLKQMMQLSSQTANNTSMIGKNINSMIGAVSSSSTSSSKQNVNEDDIMMLDILDDFEDDLEINKQMLEPKALPTMSSVQRSPFTLFNSSNPTPMSTPMTLPYKNRRESIRPVGLNEMIETIGPDAADEMVKMFAI